MLVSLFILTNYLSLSIQKMVDMVLPAATTKPSSLATRGLEAIAIGKPLSGRLDRARHSPRPMTAINALSEVVPEKGKLSFAID
ncbi:MAG: hypothetical protein M9915_03405 [Rhizobacter sp.]|nr:hypothetical protein [Rhizobacter sp.]